MKFLNKNINFIIILVVSAIVFVTFYGTSTSPLYGTGDCDSCGYILMGMEWAKGNVPYLSISDNKGPVLWFIEGIGQVFIEGKTGVYLIQCVFMFLCLLFIAKSLKELFDLSKGKQLFCCFIYLISIGSLYTGGNLTEEFSMFFIILALYCMALFINKKISYFKIGLILALCCISVIFIRINDSASIIYMWILVFFTTFSENKNKLKSLKDYFWGSISGFLIIIIPILLYYGINHAIFNIIEDYFVIGFGYAKNNLSIVDGIILRFRLLFFSIYGIILIWSFLLSIVSICIYRVWGKNKNGIIIPLIVGINISIILAAIVKPTGYLHYLIPVTISYILITAIFLQTWKNVLNGLTQHKKSVSFVFVMCIICINLQFFMILGLSTYKIINIEIIERYSEKIDNSFKELATIIPEEEKNTGLALNTPKWYLVTGTRPIIKYVWTDTLIFNKKELEIFNNSLESNPPRWLFILDEEELSILGDVSYKFFKENYILEKENSDGKIYFLKNNY